MKSLHVVCPRCGKLGSLTNRWVTSSYRPRYASMAIDHYNYKKVSGIKYRGSSKKFVINPAITEIENQDELKKHFIVRSKKYVHYYVGHYSTKKYKEQLLRYRSGLRKFRPNGRIWHYLRRGKHYRFEIIDSINWLLIKEYGKPDFIGIITVLGLRNSLQ